MNSKSELRCNCVDCSSLQVAGAEQPSRPSVGETFDVNQRQEYRFNTSDLFKTINLTRRFEPSSVLNGYGYQRMNSHPAYRTTNFDYGWLPPNAHTVPQSYFPRSNDFSELMAKCGMYRNYSLNTELDKSLV